MHTPSLYCNVSSLTLLMASTTLITCQARVNRMQATQQTVEGREAWGDRRGKGEHVTR